MKKVIFILGLVLFMFSFVLAAECGDFVCDTGENESCPLDCLNAEEMALDPEKIGEPLATEETTPATEDVGIEDVQGEADDEGLSFFGLIIVVLVVIIFIIIVFFLYRNLRKENVAPEDTTENAI